jgi:hypothetical protein
VTDKTQLKVFETTDTGVRTELTVDTNYTVAGIGVDAGGTITRVAGNLPTGYTWYIRSDYKETQLSALPSQGPFFPDIHENAFDKLTFLIQQFKDATDRTIRLTDEVAIDGNLVIEDDAAARASNFLGFDAEGDILISAGVPEIPVSPFMVTVVDDVDALAATGTLKTGYVATKAEAALLTPEEGRKVFITGADGGEFTMRTGAAASTYNDNGGAYAGTKFKPTSGDGSTGFERVFSGVVNVVWFGATGDGVTDDYVAIQLAATYAVSNRRRLYLPAGNYRISTGVILTDAIVIHGDGIDLTTVTTVAIGAYAFTFQKPLSGVSKGASVRDMTIDGVSKSANTKAIYIDSNQIMGAFEHVRFVNLGYGIEIHSDAVGGVSYGHQITDCRFNGIFYKGIWAYGNSEQLLIQHCWFQAGNNAVGNNAIHITSSTSTQILGCIFQVFYDAIYIEGGKPVAIKNCHFEDNVNHNIVLTSSSSYWCDCVEITGNYMRAGKRGVYITSIASREGQGLYLANNTFTEITDTGVAGGTLQSPIYSTSQTAYIGIVCINNLWHKGVVTSIPMTDGFVPELEVSNQAVSRDFTPVVEGASTPGVGTYLPDQQIGKYRLVAGVCHIQIRLAWSAHTGVGDMRITGLPFPVGDAYAAFSSDYSTLTVGAGKTLSALAIEGSTRIDMRACDPAGGALTNVIMDSSVGGLFISGSYQIA